MAKIPIRSEIALLKKRATLERSLSYRYSESLKFDILEFLEGRPLYMALCDRIGVSHKTVRAWRDGKLQNNRRKTK